MSIFDYILRIHVVMPIESLTTCIMIAMRLGFIAWYISGINGGMYTEARKNSGILFIENTPIIFGKVTVWR